MRLTIWCARPCTPFFLYHSIQVGNADQLAVYELIYPELHKACEDVVLNRRSSV